MYLFFNSCAIKIKFYSNGNFRCWWLKSGCAKFRGSGWKRIFEKKWCQRKLITALYPKILFQIFINLGWQCLRTGFLTIKGCIHWKMITSENVIFEAYGSQIFKVLYFKPLHTLQRNNFWMLAHGEYSQTSCADYLMMEICQLKI